MARVCHTNNCPVGVASQREELRARFPGCPGDLVNYFHFVAEEVRGAPPPAAGLPWAQQLHLPAAAPHREGLSKPPACWCSHLFGVWCVGHLQESIFPGAVHHPRRCALGSRPWGCGRWTSWWGGPICWRSGT
jgi:Conserved region in glutamate synthase